MISLADVRRAAALLKPVIHRTPLSHSHILSEKFGAEIHLKMENLQRTGSFKARGAYVKIAGLPPAIRRKGVVTASAGNHAQGVAYAAARFGVKATIVMPLGSSLMKEQACRALGAQVMLRGESLEEAREAAKEIADQEGKTYIPPFDDPAVVAGQGTLALEILRDLPSADAIVTSVGGGGLLSGLALAAKKLKPRVKVWGVQAAGAAAMIQSLKRRKVVALPRVSTIADGIAVARPGKLTYSLVRRWADGLVAVSDEAIAEAVLFLMEHGKTVVEGAAAAPLAALFEKKIAVRGKKIVLVLSGGNIDSSFLSRIIEKGLVQTGRLVETAVLLPDKPGQLERLARVVAGERANVIAIEHRRDKLNVPIGQAQVNLRLETRGPDHAADVLRALKGAGYPPLETTV